jgi:hypothetical protein
VTSEPSTAGPTDDQASGQGGLFKVVTQVLKSVISTVFSLAKRLFTPWTWLF